MDNLEQQRACDAISVVIESDENGNDSENIAKKIPTMILNNGLIATAAFAYESDKIGYRSAFVNGIINHLETRHFLSSDWRRKAEQTNSIADKDAVKKETKLFIAYLCCCSSEELRDLTDEILLYLNYLRRFA